MRAIEAATMNVRLITGNTRWLVLDQSLHVTTQDTVHDL